MPRRSPGRPFTGPHFRNTIAPADLFALDVFVIYVCARTPTSAAVRTEVPLEPLTPLTYQILVSLAGRPLHGYGIIKEIEERSGPASAPSTGALYLALQRMEEAGLIEEPAERPAGDDDARRRYYRLTERGRERARAESERLEGLLATARDRNLLPESAS